MPTIRAWSFVLAAVATVLALVPSPARADVDMTGRWRVGTGFGTLACIDVVQTATQLDVHRCDDGGFAWTGTIDPVSGEFSWQEDSISRATGTVAPGGTTFAGTIFVYHCTFVGCGEIPFDLFGSRCGGGTADPGEQCDAGAPDGTHPAGACCTNECTLVPAGTTCDADANPATDDACDAAGTCLPVPPPTCEPCLRWDTTTERCVADVRTGCHRPLGAASRLVMTTTSRDAADAVTWTWTGDSSTAPADFGDPRGATAFEACVFADEGAGGTAVVMASVILPGGTCGARPCWSANGAATTFRHRNARADGVRSVKLASGVKTKIRLGGKGAGLGLPATFDDTLPPITVQVRRTDGPTCWEARFSALDKSTATRVRARDGQ